MPTDANQRRYPALVGLQVLAAFCGCLPMITATANEVDFDTQIRPLLSQHCLHCHGPDESERQGEFRLDTFADATARSDGHAGIVPGKPNESEVIRRMETNDPDARMPPPDAGDRLSNAEISLLRQWIATGAQYEPHWAYQPIRKPDVPELSDLPAGATDIDRFVVAELRNHGLTLAVPAGKPALIRRATFDLLGLPPTWQEVQSFVNDTSEDAFAKVIDCLLDSPRYGERWGRHWLDIARYADTHGGGAIGFTKFPFSYTYRDYVIRAFNQDLPYDRFVLEQIAADQLKLSGNDAALAALGFLTVGRQYRNVHDLVDDRIDVVTRGLLGLTVTCARCHDHKYDAIPTSDYYALYAALGHSEPPPVLPIVGTPTATAAYSKYHKEFEDLQFRHDEMAREQSEILRNRLRMQVGDYLKEIAKGTPEQDLSTIFLSYRTDDLRPLIIEKWRKYLAGLDSDDPVFGPWHRLAQLEADGFSEAVLRTIEILETENGDTSQLKLHEFGTRPPRWNPRVLQAVRDRSPHTMLEVADSYGNLFAKVQEEWTTSLLAASLETRPDHQVVPDQDTRHAHINSSVSRQLRYHLHGPGTPTVLTDQVAQTILNRPIRDHVNGLQAAVHNLHLSSPGSPPRAMSLVENPSPEVQHVFRRGNPLDRGAAVMPRFLSALTSRAGLNSIPFTDGQRRLGLARAIVHPANPLTRRVVVNWVWQRHFGLGLVRTPDDFGTRGESPTHAQLLDYLAESLLKNNWSVKSLHRQIMRSRVYQQASIEDPASRQKDPQNRLIWRMPRRRLELEAMRDALLAAAGRLDTSMGGRPFDLVAEPYVPRRSVYGFVNRDVIPGLFSTFDAADPSVCVAQRPQTTVPQQTLFALNSEFIQEQAENLARLSADEGARTREQRITVLYQRAFSRGATAEELAIAQRYIHSQEDEDGAWRRFAHALLAANEFVFVD